MVHYQKSLACPLLVPIQLNFALELHFSYSFIIFQGRQRNHYYIIISICCNWSIYFNSMVQKLLCDTVYESIFSISLIQNQNQTWERERGERENSKSKPNMRERESVQTPFDVLYRR